MEIKYTIPQTVALLTGGRGENCPHGKLNVKTGVQLNLYFGVIILLVFSRLLFCVFLELFSCDLGF